MYRGTEATDSNFFYRITIWKSQVIFVEINYFPVKI